MVPRGGGSGEGHVFRRLGVHGARLLCTISVLTLGRQVCWHGSLIRKSIYYLASFREIGPGLATFPA
jgi:hypothetical protein